MTKAEIDTPSLLDTRRLWQIPVPAYRLLGEAGLVPKNTELLYGFVLDYDRAKLRAYATAGVAECWLVLGHEKQVEVYRRPEAGQYAECTRHEAGTQLQSSSVVTISVALGSLFAL